MSIVHPTQEAIDEAGRILRDGGVVVIPTETVYGLACDALNPEAVRRVFEIKGRPSENPLIIHLADSKQLELVAQDIPDLAWKIAERYWPGPLTLVLKKRMEVPAETTGGLDTVAVRVPRHFVARDVIRAADRPIAAPSANVFMGLSPTSVEDLDPEILVDVDLVLDGGRCEIGLESTVIDLTSDVPRILRPGAISRADIQILVGSPLGHVPHDEIRKSPGMHRRHYAPGAPVELVKHQLAELDFGLTFFEAHGSHQIKMPRNAQAYGAVLYGALKRLDLQKPARIFVEEPPVEPEWEAVWDRLKKASASLL
jgi:L-threonylcarbamoyladenylate synthase